MIHKSLWKQNHVLFFMTNSFLSESSCGRCVPAERERERVRFMVQTCSLGLQLTHKLLLRESAVSRRPAGSAGRLPRSAAFTRCSDTFMGRRAARCEEEPQVDLDKETCWKISNTVLGQLKRAPAVIPEEKQQLCRNKTTTWTTNKTKQDSQKLN